MALFGLRGPYFAIGTLGVAVAAREVAGTIEIIGAGAGIAMPFLPLPIEFRATFFYVLCVILAVAAHFVIKWLFKTQFGLAANAIRDDEDKAEAMGIPTLRYKQVGWAIAAFFMGCIGAVFGNMVGTLSPCSCISRCYIWIFMVAMSLLGGKGTLWGPVLARSSSTLLKRLRIWRLQWVVLGLILIVNIAHFQQGIMGWLQTKYPEKFGIVVDEANTASRGDA